jgi:8-oxo-dGTP pyrophosphatase MutT (NUDIX family)
MNETHQRIAVYGLIFNSSKEILVVKRSLHDSHPGLWEMPGGALEYREQPHEGALREIKEETNLDVELLYPISTSSGFSKKKPDIQVVRIAFLCLSKNSDPLSLSHEHIEYQWVKPEQITLSPLSKFLQSTLQIISLNPKLITAL